MKNMKTIAFIIGFTALQLTCFSQGDNLKPHYIGEKFGGGIIFYIDGTGQHGLISADKDQSGKMFWYDWWISERVATDISDGMPNTKAIVKKLGLNTAAGMCDSLTLNGYNDWYLPSIKELSLMYNQLMKIGGFSLAIYISSTQDVKKLSKCYAVDFRKSGREKLVKVRSDFFVRAIRKF